MSVSHPQPPIIPPIIIPPVIHQEPYEPEICPICREVLRENGTITLSCNHTLDIGCFIRLIEIHGVNDIRCPLCRAPLIMPVDDEDQVPDEDEEILHHINMRPHLTIRVKGYFDYYEKLLDFLTRFFEDSDQSKTLIIVILVCIMCYKLR